MRIGSLWVHEKDGVRTMSGEISADAGINLPAGTRLSCKIAKNEKKQAGDKLPDWFIEAWVPREKTAGTDQGEQESPPPF